MAETVAPTVHTQIEKEIFGRAVRGATDDDALLAEARGDYASVKHLAAQIRTMMPDEPLCYARVTGLAEHVASCRGGGGTPAVLRGPG
ncbi:MAG: hypothetical protein J7530_06395 [Novosphingobium sp.]|nr:hypothetical protein [Novosphingobium sp.]